MSLVRSVSLLTLASTLTVAALLLAAPTPAEGQRGLTARVFLTQRQLPKQGSEAGLLGFLRRNSTKRLSESTEATLNERKWTAEMITSFSRPVDDLEFHVALYDITDGNEGHFLEDMSTYVNDRSQKTFVTRLRLRRPRFRPNRRMEGRVVVRRQQVGAFRFELIGEEEQRSGRVDFSDEDTRAPD